MTGRQEITFTLRNVNPAINPRQGTPAGPAIPRIARLMALAIRLERLVREGTIADYAEAARLGRVTPARMTQIMRLLDLAPDIQEMILFLPAILHLNERSLRPVVAEVAWGDQRLVFQRIAGPLYTSGGLA